MKEIIGDDKPCSLLWPRVHYHYSWSEIAKDYFTTYGSNLVYICDANADFVPDILYMLMRNISSFPPTTTLQSLCFLRTFSYELPSLFCRDLEIEYENPWPSRELYDQLKEEYPQGYYYGKVPTYDELEKSELTVLSWESPEEDKRLNAKPLLLPRRVNDYLDFCNYLIYKCSKSYIGSPPRMLLWSRGQVSRLELPNIEDARDVSMWWGWEDFKEVEPGVQLSKVGRCTCIKWYEFFRSLTYYPQLKNQLENSCRKKVERDGIKLTPERLTKWVEFVIENLIYEYLKNPNKTKEILEEYDLNKNEIDHVLGMLEKGKEEFEPQRKSLTKKFEEYLFKDIFSTSLKLSKLIDDHFIASYNLHDSLRFKDGELKFQGLYVEDTIEPLYSSPKEFLSSFMDVAQKCFEYTVPVKVTFREGNEISKTVSVLASNSRMKIEEKYIIKF